MPLIKTLMRTGLAVMTTVALATMIWPSVGGLVSGLLVTVLCAGTGALVALVARWIRGELAWRHELRAMPPADATVYGALAELRQSA